MLDRATTEKSRVLAFWSIMCPFCNDHASDVGNGKDPDVIK